MRGGQKEQLSVDKNVVGLTGLRKGGLGECAREGHVVVDV
jgi:hypothetical protein